MSLALIENPRERNGVTPSVGNPANGCIHSVFKVWCLHVSVAIL